MSINAYFISLLRYLFVYLKSFSNSVLISSLFDGLVSINLSQGLHKLLNSNKSFAIGVTSYAFPIQRALSIQADAIKKLSEHKETRSQDLEDYYHDAAHFCWGSKEAFIEKKDFFSSDSIPIVIPRSLVQDIDTPEDWEFAELLYKAKK